MTNNLPPGPLLEDVLLCARTVWGEARSEDQVGRRAVAHVMINRW